MLTRLATLIIAGIFLLHTAAAQNPARKALDHSDYDLWKAIEKPQISNDGRWVIYELNPGEGDGQLLIHDGTTGKDRRFERAGSASISADNRFAVFKITPHRDTVLAQRRRKVKKDDLPKDTLGILELATGNLTKVADVQSFQLPAKWGGWLAYHKEPGTTPTDTTAATNGENKSKKAKKESRDNGSTLVIRNLSTAQETLVAFAKSYAHAREGAKFVVLSTGNDADFQPGVYVFDANKGALQPVWQQKGDYKNLTFDKAGTQLAFVADHDTTKVRLRPFALYHWRDGQAEATLVADDSADFLPANWRISENGNLRFSEDAAALYFGIAPEPVLPDTSLLEEEIVKVEVWAYNDPVLHTMQNVRLEREKRRSYDCILHTNTGKIVQLATPTIPDIQWGNEGKAPVVMGYTQEPYGVESTWEWWSKRDVYLVDKETGNAKIVQQGLDANVQFSPGGKYLYWYSFSDTAWFTHDIERGATKRLTDNNRVTFYNELDDHPDDPPAYGIAGWLKDDAAILIYDRYDLWRFDPNGAAAPVLLTNGRKAQRRFRYIRTDDEQRFIEPGTKLLLSVFEEPTKKAGYAWLDLSNNNLTQVQLEDYNFSNRPFKAKNAEKWVFTRENFQVFPDLLYGNDLKTGKKISDANPQQRNYSWGTAELVEWASLDGIPLQGILYKPENFDPKKQYPMMVYFYERMSDGLHRYHTPAPGRSSINFSFYASRGYLVFIPDIPYRIGYPGESCYNAVIPGVTALINKGFVDKARIGVQGHSWGGYQIAYLLTRTNIFKCAESGAPVVNMFSAYGGIRWGSGLSRSAQYERTQSRIGGSPWQYPLRYIENSPLFAADKIQTPVLILHNDKDDAVPWYQGIEFYVAMRRLSNPAWLLNYNGEPHGITKKQNRKDFQLRMQQFFDHYLMDAPMPQWMSRGVPAIEKGIRQGYELVSDQE